MKRLLTAGFALALLLIAAQAADAQVYQVYYPAAPVTTYYAPAPVAVAPAATTVYYPTAVPVTRYRPLLGGTVTRWRYVNQPTYVYPTTAYYPAW
jgi:hypothetical protein